MEDVGPTTETQNDISTPTMTTLHGVFLMFNGALGAGILNLPYVFMRTGNFIHSVVIEVGVMILTFITYYMIAYMTCKFNHTSYMEIIGMHLGDPIRILSEVFIVFYTILSTTAYVVILGNQFTIGTSLFVSDMSAWYVDRRFLMVVGALVLFLPFLFPKDLAILGKTSILGALCSLYIAFAIMGQFFVNRKKSDYIEPPQTLHPTFFSYLNLITGLVFGFQNHLSTVSVLSQLRTKSIVNYSVVVGVSLFGVGIVYGIVGTCGMLTFGVNTNPDILLNYEAKNIPMGVARFMIMLLLIVSHSMTAYMGRLALHNMIDKIKRYLTKSEESSEFKIENVPRLHWYLSAVCWFILTAIIGIFVPNIGRLIPYLGFFASYIIFICPGVSYAISQIIYEEGSRCKVISVGMALFIVVIGSIILAGTIMLLVFDKFIP